MIIGHPGGRKSCLDDEEDDDDIQDDDDGRECGHSCSRRHGKGLEGLGTRMMMMMITTTMMMEGLG